MKYRPCYKSTEQCLKVNPEISKQPLSLRACDCCGQFGRRSQVVFMKNVRKDMVQIVGTTRFINKEFLFIINDHPVVFVFCVM